MSIQKRSSLILTSATALSLSVVLSGNANALDITEDDYALKLLGKFAFFDEISNPERQSCASCHDPRNGGTTNSALVNMTTVAVRGANFHTIGNLKPPTNAYASFIAPFDVNCGVGAPGTGGACGGNFWDGRAEGRAPEDGGAIASQGATKHIGEEVFQGIGDPQILNYAKYFGPTADQALNPFPNPVEQNIQRQAVCGRVASSEYAQLYELAWGVPINCSDEPVAESAPDADIIPEREFDISYKRIVLGVCAWQHSNELNSFSSKRDIALRAELACLDGAADADPDICGHPNYLNSPGNFPLVGLTDQENLGHDLFYNRRPIPFAPRPPQGPPFNLPPFPDLPEANCSFCHTDNPGPVGPGPRDDGSELQQLYADDAYHNIGTPANPQLPADPSPGLSGHLEGVLPGFFKTPTLRNVDKRKHSRFIKAYTHNGWFKSLESLIHFYNTAAIEGETAASFGVTRCPDHINTERRALRQNCWPAPEWPDTSGGPPLIGDLGMNAEQEAALVAYLKTLTDSVTPEAPDPSKLQSIIDAL